MESNIDAREGSFLHQSVIKAYKYGDYTVLDDEQRRTINFCLNLLKELTNENNEILFEIKIPINSETNRRIFKDGGTLDVLFKSLYDGTATIVDWKFGRVEPQYDAAHDLQGLAYAVGVHNHYSSISKVIFHRFHPRVWSDMRHTSVVYSGGYDYWDSFTDVIKKIVRRSTPDAKAIPGETQCLYCKAKMSCQEFIGWSQLPTVNNTLPVLNDNVTPEALSQILDFCGQCQKKINLFNKMHEDAKILALNAIESNVAVPGYEVKAGRKVRYITNIVAARQAMNIMPDDVFFKACNLKVSELERYHKLATGLKGKMAIEDFNARLGDNIEYKENRPQLVKISDMKEIPDLTGDDE